jgi:hypothetical protein
VPRCGRAQDRRRLSPLTGAGVLMPASGASGCSTRPSGWPAASR